jgi:hypothetical protein
VEATLSIIYGHPVKLDPAVVSAKHPVPSRVFLARWLHNLKQIYAVLHRDWQNAYLINELIRVTRPGDVEVVRDAGVFLYQMKRYGGEPSACLQWSAGPGKGGGGEGGRAAGPGSSSVAAAQT